MEDVLNEGVEIGSHEYIHGLMKVIKEIRFYTTRKNFFQISPIDVFNKVAFKMEEYGNQAMSTQDIVREFLLNFYFYHWPNRSF